jgi:hypothetical protein
MNTRMDVARLLIKLSKMRKIFTIEMHDGTKYVAGLADPGHLWAGFNELRATKLTTGKGVIHIDLYQVKDIY